MNAIAPISGLLTLAIDQLDTASGYQQRHTAASPEADAGLAESIRDMGVLTPILVRWDAFSDRHQVVDGHRRVAAARAVGLDKIPATELDGDEKTALAAGVAANTQRAALAPVDLWRAIVHLQGKGWTLDGAAGALGLTKRTARQLDKLGRLHPAVLSAIEQHGMPPDADLADIAIAPHQVQQAAMENPNSWDDDYDEKAGTGTIMKVPDWNNVAGLCQTKRIPQSRAIFDTATVEIQWDEDLFAQPHDADRFTTTDIDGFLAAQTAALVAKTKRGKLRAVEWDGKAHEPRLPAGWTRCFDQKTVGAVRFAAVNPTGWNTGCIVEIFAVAPPEPRTSKVAAAPESPTPEAKETAASGPKVDQPAPDGAELVHDDAGAEPDAEDVIPAAARSDPPPSKKRPPLTEKGQIMVAAAKTTAIRCALRDRRSHLFGDVLAILVLAIAGDNVLVRGDPTNAYRGTTFHDLAARLVRDDGTLADVTLAEVTQIGAEAAARIVVCDPTGGRGNTSGRVAEWIGMALEAHRDMPRLDTAEILATVSGDALKAADIARGGTGKGTSKAIRERLAGNAEDLILPGSTFAAPGPTHRPTPDGFTPCQDCDEPADCKAARKCWANEEPEIDEEDEENHG